jgi:ribokinase
MAVFKPKDSTGRVVVVGSLNMDLVVEAQRFPEPGETFEGERFYTAPGGKGANQAVAAARLATQPNCVDMVGMIGPDVFGRQLLETLDGFGVGRRCVRMSDGEASGIALIFIDGSRENYIVLVPGANARCGLGQVMDAGALLEGASVLLVQQETPLDVTLECMKTARSLGVTTILDPAPFRKDAPEGFLGPVDIITPNQHEAAQLTGMKVASPEDARRAADFLHNQGVPAVIVTLGAAGCYAVSEPFTGWVEAFEVQPVATVAAGDAFNGGLASGLASGLTLERAIQLASAAAAISVTRPGAQESMPDRRETEEFLASRLGRTP